MVIEDNGMYILYNDNGRCLSSGENLETLENAIDRYAKKAAGKRHRFEDMVNYTDSFSTRFTKHEQLVKELWAQKFAYKYEDWQEIVEQHVEHIVLLAVLEDEIASKRLFFLGRVYKLLNLIDRAELYFHIRILARLLGTLVEDVADMFRLDIHLDEALALVHDDLRGIAVIDHLLEVRVRSILADAAVLGTSA